MDLSKLLTAILLLPLGSAALIALFLRRRGNLAAILSVAVGFAIMALSLDVLLTWNGQDFHASWVWMQFGRYTFSMGYYFNHETALMLLVVSFVASWIQLFSIGYMDDDDSKGRFFGGLSIFMFSILGIVLADNLAMLFVFWELVGFSSYMLIAHYFTTDFANMASKKAFIVNRVGDFGFLLGIVWCWNHYGTINLLELQTKLAGHGELLNTHRGIAIGLLLMCGFIGKSAQFPLQVWLTDAMAGPTPVSALIHAATMVAAGIYFLARVFFLLAPFTLHWIMWSGAAMTVFAGLCALGQTDIKKTLAYSTLAQLGYMACAVGLGYPQLALFHLAMHACFKATLFLGSGSVIHACHHEQDIYKMGGLWKKMPLTGLSFLLASLANCAIPFFSGGYSKDSIITAAFLKGQQDGPVFFGVYAFVLFGALCTALYTGRLFYITFLGSPRSEEASHAHESSPLMTIPLLVLGFLSLGAGWAVYGWTWGGHFTGLLPSSCAVVFIQAYNDVHEALEKTGSASMLEVANLVMAVTGLVVSYLFYARHPAGDALAAKSPRAFHVLERHGWFDDVYDWYVAQVQQRICDLIGAVDLLLFKFTLGWGSGGVAGLTGSLLRRLQTGSIHAYVYWFLAGVILFWALAVH